MAFIGPAIKAFLIIYKATSIAMQLAEWWEGPPPDPWRWWRRIFWAVFIVLFVLFVSLAKEEQYEVETLVGVESVGRMVDCVGHCCVDG